MIALYLMKISYLKLQVLHYPIDSLEVLMLWYFLNAYVIAACVVFGFGNVF